ncbi:MAG TPA: tRNA-uridine aminocarboxypropyltransferase [Myxococcota bacterium]|jgi:hypothetical protein
MNGSLARALSPEHAVRAKRGPAVVPLRYAARLVVRHLSTESKCPRCFLKTALCMCSLLPSMPSQSHVVVVMHAYEHLKSTNTGRIAHRCLPNSSMVLYGERHGPVLPLRTWPEGTTPVVLFPVAGAQPIADFRGHKNLALIALDANWRQAAKLRKHFAVQSVPFAQAPAGPSTYRLRASTHEGGMSTLEAIARSLAVVEDIDVEPLLRAFAIYQDRLLWLRGSIGRADVAGGVPDDVNRSAR